MIDNAPDLIKFHEGYREDIYLDSLGYVSTGYGFCLDSSKPFQSVKEWHDYMFQVHYEESYQIYVKLCLNLDPVREAAVLDLLYNMKYKFTRNFGETIAHLRKGEWEDAAQHLEATRWYKQVGRRGPRICTLIRTGSWEALNTIKERAAT